MATQDPRPSASSETAASDRELLARYRKSRSEEAFAALVERYTPMVYGACLRITRDAHAAEDASQAAFLVLLRRIDTLVAEQSIAGWLHAAAQTTAKDLVRSNMRRQTREREAGQDAQMETVDPALASEHAAVLEHVDAAIAALPGAQRSAVVLRYLQGLEPEAAARQMRCSQQSVRVQLSRGLSRIREFLQRRGIMISGAMLPVVLAETAVGPAPVGLTASIVSACTGKVAASAAAVGAADCAVRTFIWLKLKAAAIVAAIVVAVTVPVVYGAAKLLDRPPPPLIAIAIAPHAPAPAPQTPAAIPVALPRPTPAADEGLPKNARVLYAQKFDANTRGWRGKIVPRPGGPADAFGIESVPLDGNFRAYSGEVRSPLSDAGWRTGTHTYLRFKYRVENFRELDAFKLMFKRADQMNFTGFVAPPKRGEWGTLTVRVDDSVGLDEDRGTRLKAGETAHALIWMARSKDENPPRDARFWIDDVTLFECPDELPAVVLTAEQ